MYWVIYCLILMLGSVGLISLITFLNRKKILHARKFNAYGFGDIFYVDGSRVLF